jgi:hypothetical protein
MELFDHFDSYFEKDLPDDEFDEDEENESLTEEM